MQNKISKKVDETLRKLKEELGWKEVAPNIDISARLEMTCKYILQKGTAIQLAQAAKRKSAGATKTKQRPSLSPRVKAVNTKSKPAIPVKPKPMKKTTSEAIKSPGSKSKLPTKTNAR